MLNKTEQLSRLTASRELCEQLVGMGVIPWAVLWHMKTEDGFEIDVDEFGEGYSEGEAIPAWTKEELDVMLGPIVRLPQLADPLMIGRLGDPNVTVWYGANSRIDCAKGADCSARVLQLAIQQGGVKVEKANKRFLDVFQLVQRGLIDLANHPPIRL